MISFPVQNIANIGKTVYVFNRQKDGKLLIYQDHTFYPYFYNECEGGLFRTIDGKRVNKVICSNPSEVARKRTNESYESDVLFSKRFLIDKVQEILPSPTKYFLIDIEIQCEELPSYNRPDNTITVIGLYNSGNKEIKQWFIADYKTQTKAEAEDALLNDFIKYVKNEQPDLLLGWNLVAFDYPYLAKRIEKLWGLKLAELISPIGKTRYGRKEDNIDYPAGISVLDYMDLFKKIYRAEVSYALDAIAQKYLKVESVGKFDFSKISKEVQEKNLIDIQRMVALEDKQKVINYYDEIRRMSKCFWEDLTWNSRVLDMMLLAEARKMNVILPSRHYSDDIEDDSIEFEGAYRKCETGRFEQLHKLDLSSAYPMAIIDFCLDIANFTDNIYEQKIDITDRETNEIKSSVYFKQNPNALLPTLARKLIIKKDYLKKELKIIDPESEEGKDLQTKYDAVKSLVNSLFGVAGLKVFRLYKVEIASAITSIVRSVLRYVEEHLKEQGMKVVYLDTDSVFVEAKENPTELCNQLIKQWAKEIYNKDSIGIEFDYEGYFEKILVIALCHYVGDLRKKNGKLKQEIKGVESKRKDSSKYIKDFQTELIERVLNNETQEQIAEFINAEKERIKTLNLVDIGFPAKINVDKEYKSIPVFKRALEYSKELFNLKKVPGDTFWWIYVEKFGDASRTSRRTVKNKETGKSEEKTSETTIDKNVLAFDEETVKNIKAVDWNKIIDKSILGKAEHIFEALKWDLSLIKEVKVKKIKKEVKEKIDANIAKITSEASAIVEKFVRKTHKEIAKELNKELDIKRDKCKVCKEENEQHSKYCSAHQSEVIDKEFTLNHSFKTKAEVTERTIIVSEAFGLGIDDEKDFTIYDNATLKVKTGDIIYITGDSGSGKSWLLKNIFAKFDNAISIDDLKIDENEVVVEGVGTDLNDALMKLNIAGLGDAFLYLRKYSQLSDGQKYRYRIAKFIDLNKDVWILDEFCATLDRVTAKVVAFNLQKIARKLNKTVIVATTHTDLFEEIRSTVHILKGYESDVNINYYKHEDWKDKKLELYNDIKVEVGNKEDYAKLKKFHYRQASLGALKQVYKCTYKDEVIGVIVVAYPHLALKGRNVALNNKLAKMTKENCNYINKHIDYVARVIIHPKYRGIGLSKVMLESYFKLTDATYVETVAVMANYNPFFEKAGMQRIDVDLDPAREEAVKELEKYGYSVNLISSTTYIRSVFNKLTEEQKNEVREIVIKIVNRYKGASHIVFAKINRNPSWKEDLKANDELLFEYFKQLRRSNTVYLIRRLKDD